MYRRSARRSCLLRRSARRMCHFIRAGWVCKTERHVSCVKRSETMTRPESMDTGARNPPAERQTPDNGVSVRKLIVQSLLHNRGDVNNTQGVQTTADERRRKQNARRSINTVPEQSVPPGDAARMRGGMQCFGLHEILELRTPVRTRSHHIKPTLACACKPVEVWNLCLRWLGKSACASNNEKP